VSTVYLASAVRARVEAAQAVLDTHPAGMDGICLCCGGAPSCGRAQALRVLARYGRLPRRRPGATRSAMPDPGTGRSGWFSAPGVAG